MTNVTKIDWTVQTGDQWWSGTDTQIKIEIMRDDHLIQRINLEPGKTPRLNRGEHQTYFWVFKSADSVGTSVSGTAIPFFEFFPNGIKGHLRVRLVAKGDDAWEKVSIESNVFFGELRNVPGTIDEVRWNEDWETYLFGRDIVLSTDKREGFSSLTLNY
jgi:hypothetical protein